MNTSQKTVEWIEKYISSFGAMKIRESEQDAYETLSKEFSQAVIRESFNYLQKAGVPPFGRAVEYAFDYLQRNKSLLFLVDAEMTPKNKQIEDLGIQTVVSRQIDV